MRAVHFGISWGGLFAGPFAWAVSTQLNYVLAPWQCTHGIRMVVPAAALALALFALLGGALSWRAWRRGGAAFKPGREAGTERFVATIGMMAAGLFALVVLMQGTAGLVLDGCVR
jgi:hypothetical protein